MAPAHAAKKLKGQHAQGLRGLRLGASLLGHAYTETMGCEARFADTRHANAVHEICKYHTSGSFAQLANSTHECQHRFLHEHQGIYCILNLMGGKRYCKTVCPDDLTLLFLQAIIKARTAHKTKQQCSPLLAACTVSVCRWQPSRCVGV